mmetsp:Transcript_183733/g.447344  ORF Transcript_183733/g.447344 Transcript_183733/m.447344 type:complete len:102 (+) Transcript_183733:109-414(+)
MKIVDLLVSENVSVQLEHDDTETSWEDHGWVKLSREDGQELASHSDFQHNRNFRAQTENAAKIVEEVLEKLKATSEDASEKAADVPAPTLSRENSLTGAAA